MSTAFGSIGLNLMVTVLFKQAYDFTGDELDIGLLGLAQFIPAVLLVLVSGWVADRFDRRRVTALFLFARALCAGALVIYSMADATSLLPMFAIAFAFGAAEAMLSPARRAIPPLITTPTQFPHVIALWTATFTASAIVGPVLGGFLYSIGPAEAYAVAGVMELLAIVPVLLITYVRVPERITERPTLSTALEGLHFVRHTPIVLAAISLDLFAVLFGGAIALIPAVAEERLGVGDIAYGWLRAAPGIGAALMAVMLAVRPVRRRVGPTLLVVVAIFGFGTVVFGVHPQLRGRIPRPGRDLGGRHDLDVHPRLARAAGDARRSARAGDGRRGCVHRRLERARCVRERRRRQGVRIVVVDRTRGDHDDADRHVVRVAVPLAAPDRLVRRGAAPGAVGTSELTARRFRRRTPTRRPGSPTPPATTG